VSRPGGGVVAQHAQHLADGRGRGASSGGVGVDLHLEVAPVQCQARAPLRGQLAEQRAEVDGDGRRSLAGASQRQHLVDDRPQVVGVDQAGGDRGAGVDVGPIERGLQAQPHPGQGGAELVGGVGGEGPLAGEQVIQPGRGRVEGCADPVRLSPCLPRAS
jgi:hypothetical protein